MTQGHSAIAAENEGGSAEASVSTAADGLVEKLVALRPWLRNMQGEAERQRRIPQETVERLNTAGIYSLTTPPRFGGADFSTRDLFRIYEAFGRGCGAERVDSLGCDRWKSLERSVSR